MIYIKNTITGAIYEVKELPKYSAAWELSTRAEYENWQIKNFGKIIF